MGKREFLIAAAFLVCGVIAYQVSVPDQPDPDEGFSLRGLIDEIRDDIRSDSSSAEITHELTIDVRPGLREVRLGNVPGQLTVSGEDRDDIGYELHVRSTGPSEREARAYAERTVLLQDDLDDVLALRVSYPREGTQRTSLVMRVPRHLAVRVDGGRGGDMQDLGALHLEDFVGDVTATRIAGALSGSHRSGRLRVVEAGSVRLTLRGTRAAFDGVRDGVTVTATSGECEVTGSAGPIAIEESNADVLVAEHDGPIEIRGTGGEIRILHPTHVVGVDVRRSDVRIELSAAVPMTVFTTDDPIVLTLVGPPAIALDALVNGRGNIDADDFGLTPEVRDDRTMLTHAFGDGVERPRVSLRNLRDDIVIRERR